VKLEKIEREIISIVTREGGCSLLPSTALIALHAFGVSQSIRYERAMYNMQE
jgi:hypothetical protein